MANSVKVKLNSRGMVALLQSTGVGDELESRMRRVSAAYGPSDIVRAIHGDRVVVQVWSDKPRAFFREANSGDLARAFGAAGGA